MGPPRLPQNIQHFYFFFFSCCFTPTETMGTTVLGTGTSSTDAMATSLGWPSLQARRK